MREEFASYSFLAVTVVGLVLLCSGLIRAYLIYARGVGGMKSKAAR